MKNNLKDTWETYVCSWNTTHIGEKQALFKKCLDSACSYNDPIAKAKGWNELEDYMVNFHRQFPGGHFVTTLFMAHSNKSVARWEMRDGLDNVLDEGISYGEYNGKGYLVTLTGFFQSQQKLAQ